MYYFLQGILENTIDNRIIININGIGYEIFVPLTVVNQLPEIGEETKIYTYFHIREDQQSLYGFLSPEDKDFFILLNSVNGIGPKLALSILSQITIPNLITAIANKDMYTLNNLAGVGQKKIERIIIELKDKVIKLFSVESKNESKNNFIDSEYNHDLKLALKTLGYKNDEINHAFKNAGANLKESVELEDNLKVLLKYL